MMISTARWEEGTVGEVTRAQNTVERVQKRSEVLLESEGLSSITIIDSGLAKKILEKRVLEMLLTYILLAAAEELMLLSRFEMEIQNHRISVYTTPTLAFGKGF